MRYAIILVIIQRTYTKSRKTFTAETNYDDRDRENHVVCMYSVMYTRITLTYCMMSARLRGRCVFEPRSRTGQHNRVAIIIHNV